MYRPNKRILIEMTENNDFYEGESIETKVARMTETSEPITDTAPIIYTRKKDGVKPEFDIRTDKWDVALNAMDSVNKSKIAKSKSYILGDEEEKEKDSPKGDNG